MVDKSIPLCKPTSGRFFHHGADRRGQFLLERGSIRLLLLSLAPPTPHHDTATAPGCPRLKRKPESRGKKAPRAPSIVGSFSPQPELPSAGDSVATDVCHLVAVGCSSVTRSDSWGRDIRDSTLATTPDGPADGEIAALWPRFGEPERPSHGGRSDSPAR